MIGGAATAAPSLCKRDGCCKPVRSRGMCSAHYQAWIKANPAANVCLLNHRLMLAALPGRIEQIAEETGFDKQTVKRRLKQMHADGQARIASFDPPDVTGFKFGAVWAVGAGANAKLTKKMRVDHFNKGQRHRYAQRAAKGQGWLGALGMLSC